MKPIITNYTPKPKQKSNSLQYKRSRKEVHKSKSNLTKVNLVV